MEQIIKQNPDIMKTFANAAVQEMGNQNPGVANFMGAYGPQSQQNQMNNDPTPGSDNAFNVGTQNYSRKEMKGPSRLDDILDNLNDPMKSNNMSTNSDSDLNDIRNINFDTSRNKKRGDGNSITLDL